MNKYEVKSNIKHNGEEFKAGDEISLSDEEAKTLINADAIVDPNAEPKEEEKSTSVDDANRMQSPEEKERLRKEKREIGELSEDAESNKSGNDSNESESDKGPEYSKMEDKELIAMTEEREISHDGKSREEVIELLERSDRVRNANNQKNSSDNENKNKESGDDL